MDAIAGLFKSFHLDWTSGLLIAAVIGAVVLVRLAKTTAATPFVTPRAIHDRRENGEDLLIVDVRTPSEFSSGHIPGSVNIPLDQVRGRLDALPPEELADMIRVPVAVTCARGPRAMAAAGFFKRKGFVTVMSMAGGTSSWRKLELPWEEPSANADAD